MSSYEDPFGSPAPESTPSSPIEPTQDEKAAEKTAKKTPAKPRSAGIAMAGRPVHLEEFDTPSDFPGWPKGNQDDEYIPYVQEADYTDLSLLNRDINRTRAMSFRVKNALAEARREEVEAGDKYRKALNRQLIGLSGGTAEQRKAIAEVFTEDLNTQYLIAQNIVKEQTSLSYTISRDLETLKTLADNLRKQMSL